MLNKRIVALLLVAVLLSLCMPSLASAFTLEIIPENEIVYWEEMPNRAPTQEELVNWLLNNLGKFVDAHDDKKVICGDLSSYYLYTICMSEKMNVNTYSENNCQSGETVAEYMNNIGGLRPGDIVTWPANACVNGDPNKPNSDGWTADFGGHVGVVVEINNDGTFTMVDEDINTPLRLSKNCLITYISRVNRPVFYTPGPNDTGDLPVLSVSNTENNFTLSWNKSTWAKYRLSVSVGNTNNWQTLRDYTADDEMKCDGSVTDNNIYYYKVETIDTTDTVCKTSNIVCVHKSTNGSIHDLKYNDMIDSTEDDTGVIAHYICSVCGNLFLDENATVWTNKEALIIPKKPHVHKVEYVPFIHPTDTVVGESQHYHCRCGKNYWDEEATTLFERDIRIKFPSAANINFTKSKSYENQFVDVNKDKWYYQNVSEAFELALMKGNSDTVFNPEGNVSVVEAITMACRIHSIHATGTENFTQGNPWYQVYLDYALENGIISDEMYSSDVTRIATRAEFAEIFAKALPNIGLIEVNNVYDGDIPDVSAGASYYDAVYKLYRAGILNGSDDKKTFYPNNNISRAECAAIVSRMASVNNRIISENYIYPGT